MTKEAFDNRYVNKQVAVRFKDNADALYFLNLANKFGYPVEIIE